MITVSLDKVLAEEIKSVRIYLGENYCIPSAINTITLTCSMNVIIAGNYIPIVKTELGNLKNVENLGNINIDMSISSITQAAVKTFFLKNFL